MTNYHEQPAPESTASTESTEAGIPLGTGAFAESGAPDAFAAATTRRFRSGSFLLILVVALAALGLFFMRTLTRVSAAGTTRTEIETTIENFLKALSQSPSSTSALAVRAGGDTDGVLAVLSDDFTEKQVPLSDVHRNPFIIYQLSGRSGAASAQTGESESRRAVEQRRIKRLEEIEQAVGRLRLKSIILGTVPLANLNGQIIRVGDVIKLDDQSMQLRCTAILQDSLVVQAVEPELELSVEKTVFLRPVK